MIDLKIKKCIKCNIKIPNFGFEGQKATHCGDCKEENMIDVKNKKCIKCNIKHQRFGFKDEKATHCYDCKEPNMINVVDKKCFCGKKTPSFGYEGEKAKYCFDCKEPNMVNVADKRCKTEFCDTHIWNKAYEGYCAFCYGNLYPDSPVVRNFKTKERLVVDYIKDQYQYQYEDYDWIFDKKITDGCSKRRPDIYLDLGYQVLIIEVDENQHRQYENICENKRMMILFQDVGRPIVFIRFNPDTYTDNNNKKIKSCFSIDKKGSLKVNNKTNWNNRLLQLKENIDYWIEKKTNKTIELVQLFYNSDEI
jgi:hypothetical protein